MSRALPAADAVRSRGLGSRRTQNTVLAGALLALTALAVLHAKEVEPAAEAHVEHTALPAPAPECGAAARAQARVRRAQQAEAKAGAKIARYPYAADEGLPALALLLEAERCLALADAEQARAAAHARAQAFRTRLERDYRSHSVRYGRARAEGRRDDALAELALLLDLLGAERSPVTAELRRSQIELEESRNQENER